MILKILIAIPCFDLVESIFGRVCANTRGKYANTQIQTLSQRHCDAVHVCPKTNRKWKSNKYSICDLHSRSRRDWWKDVMVLIGNTLLRRVGFAIFVMLLEFEGDLDGEKYKPGNMIGTKGVGKVQERKWWKISGTRKCHLAERGCCTSKLALAWHPPIGGTDQSLFLCLPPRLICIATLPPQLTPFPA